MLTSDEKLCETLVLTKDEFGDDLESVLGKTLMILLEARYECQVYDDDYGIIIINYNHDATRNFGNPTIEWLTEEEREYIYVLRYGEKDDEQGSN